MSEPTPSRRHLRLIDLVALVVGYGLAAVLLKAIWPSSHEWIGPEAISAGLLYLWLGLAMSGPFLLPLDRRVAVDTASGQRHTWAEVSWLMIGCYWIAMALLVVPSRMPIHPLLGVLPILAALAYRLSRTGPRSNPTQQAPWTHRAAVIILATWPVAWLALVLLSHTLF